MKTGVRRAVLTNRLKIHRDEKGLTLFISEEILDLSNEILEFFSLPLPHP